jgi:hypothetical protein
MNLEPSEQELQMLEMMREWSGKDEFRVVIEFKDGAWETSLTGILVGRVSGVPKKMTSRGVGRTFDDAWNNMDPTWA